MQTTIRRFPFLTVFLLGLVAWFGQVQPAQAQAEPLFESDRCMMPLPATMVDLSREEPTAGQIGVDCGWLTVPEQHANPDGATIELAVAIVRSTSASPSPIPVVMLQGGPGGSTIDLFITLLSTPGAAQTAFLGGHDIVLFDQRGTLNSRPELRCPELMDFIVSHLETRLTPEEGLEGSLAAMQACHDRLAAEGVVFSAFDTPENAADVEALRLALGYDQINLYGVSYGTTLALQVMRDYPQGLAAAVLDSVAPVDDNFVVDVPQSMQRGYDALFAGCRADPACNQAYPDLENRFYALIDRLNEDPLRLQIPGRNPDDIFQLTGEQYDAVLDGYGLMSVVFQLLYSTELLPSVPKIIDDLDRTGTSTALRAVWPLLLFDGSLSYGMYYSVVCADDPDVATTPSNFDNVRPQVAANNATNQAAFAGACAIVNVDPIAEEDRTAISSDVPTLLLSGQYDPITPAANAERVAQTLPNSYVFTFPAGGHGAALSGECGPRIVMDFFNTPTQAPDISCMPQRIEWIASGRTLITPVPGQFLGSLFGVSSDQAGLSAVLLLLAGLAGLFLTGVLAVYPVSFVVRWLMGRGRQPDEAPQTTRERLGRWLARGLALLAGLLMLTFAIGLISALGVGLTINGGFGLLDGLPGWSAVVFAIPPLLIVFVLAMLICAVLAWRDRGWGVPGRLYYAALTVSLIVFLAALAPLGWLFVWI